MGTTKERKALERILTRFADSLESKYGIDKAMEIFFSQPNSDERARLYELNDFLRGECIRLTIENDALQETNNQKGGGNK
jgi:hypothetical protein